MNLTAEQAIKNFWEMINECEKEIYQGVRCKDCVHYCGFEHCTNGICDLDTISKRAVCANDFCSYSERKVK